MALVIGAGMGGLAAALRLLDRGHSVTVLEASARVAGTAGIYRRNGFNFPAGPLGLTEPDRLNQALRLLGLPPPSRYLRSHFRLLTPELDIPISEPVAALCERLALQFPEEMPGIRIVRDFLMTHLPACRKSPETCHEGLPEIPVAEFLTRRAGLHNEALIRLLGAQGTGPPVLSLSLWIRMWDFLSETGIWFPEGGIHRIADRMAQAIRARGGRIRFGCDVKEIRCEAGGVLGVETTSGEPIDSSVVISSADFRHTFTSLVSPKHLPPDFRREVRGRPLSGSVFSVALGVDDKLLPPDRPNPPHLLWKPETGDPVPWSRKTPDPSSYRSDEIWISRLSAFDPEAAPEGHSVLILRVDAPYRDFMPYRKARRPHAPDYYTTKEAMARALVAATEPVLPGVTKAVREMDVCTPLTYEFWGRRSEGAVAGWAWSEPTPRDLIRTPIRGLLAAGICANSQLLRGGIGTAVWTGIRAADAAESP